MTSGNRTNGICLKEDEQTCFYLEDPGLIGWHDVTLLVVWMLVFWCFNVAMVSHSKREKLREVKISSALSTLLQVIKISSFHTQLTAYQMYFEELTTKIRFNETIFRCGGRAEGTFVPGSDEDHMVVEANMIVCMGSQTIDGNYILADTSECRTGYTKLIITNFRLLYTNLFHSLIKTINVLQVENGIMYLSSEKMRQILLHIFKGQDQNGPAISLKIPDNFGFLIGELEIAEKDNCFAMELDSWPFESEEWFHRIRRNEWPSRTLIEKIKKLPCHVVPLGDPFSLKPHLEWRISFALAERELLRNLNDTQIQCYALLKNIFKNYIYNTSMEDFKDTEKAELSTYHIKTIVFWESEKYPSHIWQPKNLIWSVGKCLISLKEAVNDSKLEHFFHRKNNILYGKLKQRATKQAIVQNINKVLKNLMSVVIGSAYCDRQDTNFWSPYEKSHLGLPTFVLFFVHGICSPFFNELSFSKQYTKHSLMFAVYCRIVQSDKKHIDIYRSLFMHGRFPDSLDKYLNQLLYKFVNIRWAFQNYRQVSDKNLEFNKEILTILEQNAHIDGMSGKLYLATFWVAIGNYDKMDTILKSVLSSISSKTLLYVGLCTKARGYVLNEVKPVTPSKWKRLRTFVYPVAFDIFFNENDIPILPREIQLEVESMTRTLHVQHRFVIIHPLVYTYYLAFKHAQYKNNKSELSIYLKKLQQTVDNIKNGVQFHRALNILGYCYSVVGDLDEARKCFKKSLEITNRFFGEPNAAHQYLMNLHVRNQERVSSEQIMPNETRGFLPERIVLVLQALVLMRNGFLSLWFTMLLIAFVAAQTFLKRGAQDGSWTNGVTWFYFIMETVTLSPKIALAMSVHFFARRITTAWVWLLRSLETGITVAAIGCLLRANFISSVFISLVWIFILVQIYIFFSIISFRYANDMCDGFITSATMFLMLAWFLYYFSFPFISVVILGTVVVVMDICTVYVIITAMLPKG